MSETANTSAASASGMATPGNKVSKSTPSESRITTKKGKKDKGKKDDEDKDNDNYGFHGPAPHRKRQRIKWTEENDIKLLTFGIDREIKSSEYQAIADSYPEKPTAKAIMERLNKLGTERNALLKRAGAFDIDNPSVGRRRTEGSGKGKGDDQVEKEEEDAVGEGMGGGMVLWSKAPLF